MCDGLIHCTPKANHIGGYREIGLRRIQRCKCETLLPLPDKVKHCSYQSSDDCHRKRHKRQHNQDLREKKALDVSVNVRNRCYAKVLTWNRQSNREVAFLALFGQGWEGGGGGGGQFLHA